LFATYGRHILSTKDIFLTGVALDKPPLPFYALALSFGGLGVSEFAARLPAFFASLITVALQYRLGTRLWGQRVGMIAAIGVAVSPFDRVFSTTAFTDPLLTLTCLAGCVCAVENRPGGMGLCMGIALAVKPSALWFFPLIGALWIMTDQRATIRNLRSLRRLGGGFLLGAGLLLLWSVIRNLNAPGTPDFWVLNTINNTPNRLIRSSEVIPRLSSWLGYLSGISPFFMLALLGIPRDGNRVVSYVLIAYLIGLIGGYWLIAFNTYDRYLHPLIPLIWLLIGVFLSQTGRSWLILSTLVITVTLISTPPKPIGGDQGSQKGIDQVAAYLNTLPPGTLVYEHGVGWGLRFYLTESPAIQLVWLPSVTELAQKAREGRVYWVAARSVSDSWIDEAKKLGITLSTLREWEHFRVVTTSS
jgi:4-amino-4-deoxy-L-arabinose transferase-like glycosyltransferase